MKTITRLFDSEQYRNRADELLGMMSMEERKQWLDHPCTKYLQLVLEADFLDLHDDWDAGSYVAESVDGTALANATAKGQLRQIRNIADHLEGVMRDD